ncbi:MAG: glycine zipper 2TM domain-containing protein [Campylobacterales bacterium]|nr:glycine zipper 2TM domain-containing protein [Campylobacterales bacterium]
MRSFLIAATALMLVLGGCAGRQGADYDGRTYRQVKHYLVGVVVEERPVRISDDGSGAFVGALIGAIFGSAIGRGHGRGIATLGGGLVGAYVGGAAGQSNAQELTVRLDSGEHIVIVAKGELRFLPGDRVKIIKQGNTVERVDRLPNYPY